MEDIKRNYEETNIRHTKDRILWSYNDSPIGVTRMGNRTHKDSLMKKTFKDFAEACWDTHKQVGFKMKGGKRVPNCVPKNEDTIEEKKVKIRKGNKELLVWDAELRTYKQMGWELVEVSAAMKALRRRNKKTAYAKKTIAKYADAAKRGIPAHKVK